VNKRGKTAVPPESPLVPNRAIERMYAGMVESRLLERRLGRRKKPSPAHGQEACRVSALLDLGPEDFSSDVPGCVTAAFLRGEELARLLHGEPSALAGVLPEVEDSRERLQQALGVALALKRLKLDKVVVVFAGTDEVKPSVWRATWAAAARQELPLLFVVLPPEAGSEAKPFVLSTKATAAGVPGIPVDASDAIALYRVTQESLVRARAGGGPALMECIPFVPHSVKGGKKSAPPDPIAAMGETLLRRAICGPEWLKGVAAGFQARLKSL
jgi:TPP-dependent pyruvate/acetoin dehydrogenase alpha subunit